MIVWTESARADLMAIADYIAQDNPTAAADVIDRIRSRTAELARHPKIGRLGRVPPTRELVVNKAPYTIVYTITDQGVAILRVLHQRQQWP